MTARGSFNYIMGSAAVFGGRQIPSEEIDRAFGMPAGKLRERAGIDSVAHVSQGEAEIHLATRAATSALENAGCPAQGVDWLIATSETHRGYPSLAAQIHKSLGLRETCGALDVGGACLGVLNGLHVAETFLRSGAGAKALVVTADVHSRALSPGRVPGEFGGLFGDGASAFVLGRDAGERPHYRLGGFFFGCSGQYAEAIRLDAGAGGAIELVFEGEALSRAAIAKLAGVIEETESRSGISCLAVSAFATHQPNPRLVALLAKQLGVRLERFPAVARTRGNLGASTCGAALHEALASKNSGGAELPNEAIFLASLGPGLLMGGGWLLRERPRA